jgi:diadenylate cyclase
MKDFKQYILENWKLKLLSVVLATMLWFVVYLIGETKKEVSVPVSTVNLSKSYVIMKTDNAKVDITLTGRVSVLKDIKENDVRVSLNMSHMQEGENIFSISKNDVQIPRGVQIGDIRPSSIKMDIDRIIEKKVKTVVKLDKRWISEYEVKSHVPDYVIAEGPKRIWEKKTFIETFPINDELSRPEETVTVSLDMEGMQASTIKPDTVKVVLKRHSGKKTVRD